MTRVGEWELLEELGRGGMGVVYRARGSGGEEVALKLLVDGVGDPEVLARFAREVGALIDLRHPGVVRVRGSGVHAGAPWVAMDLVRGGSLQGRLEREGPLHPEEAARIGLELARTLEHVHGMGVLHRDLKPANVLLEPGGRPVVADFGLAWRRAGERLTHTGEILGSPGYMAPEQVDAERWGKPGRATDVYGLGATLHALLSGQPPFQGAGAGVLVAVLTEEPPRLSRAGVRVDPGLEEIVLRCLAKDPALRWPSARELAGALEAWLRGASRRPTRGRFPLLAAGVLAGGLVGAGAVLVMARPVDPPTPATPSPAAPAPARIAFDDPEVAAGLAREAEALEAEWLLALPRAEERLDPGFRHELASAIRGAASLEEARALARHADPAAQALALELLLERWGDLEASRARVELLQELDDLPRALVEARRTAELAPRAPEVWTSLASIAGRAGQLSELLAALDRARELQQETPAVGERFLRGRALSNLGRGEEALRELEQASQRSTPATVEWAMTLNALAEHHSGTGHPERALRVADEALEGLAGKEIGTGARYLRQQRGRALMRLRRRDEALREFTRTAELAAADGAQEVEVLLYRLLAGERVEAELEAGCAALVAASPREGSFQALHAVVLDLMGRSGPALDACRATLALDPAREEPRFLLALLRIEAGAPREALAVCTRGLLAYDPAVPALRAGRGLALLALGQLDDARREIDAALATDPISTHAWAARCRLLHAAGDAEGARAAADEALSRLPERFGMARRLLAWRDG